MISRLALCVAFALGCQRHAAPDDAIRPIDAPAKALALDVQRMLDDVARLADDEMAGRDSRDRPAITTAAELIAGTYRELGLAPVGTRYLVPFQLAVAKEPDLRHHLWLERAGESIPVEDEAFASIAFGPHAIAMGDAVFVGRNPDGKGVLDRVAVLLAAPKADAAWTPEELAQRLRVLAKGGAVAAIVVGAPDEPLPAAGALEKVFSADEAIPVVFVARPVADAFTIGGRPFATVVEKLGDRPIARPIESTRASLARRERPRMEPVPNVLATIPGSDLAHEIVILGAHYDHIGTEQSGVFCRDAAGVDDPTDGICNGADDNASGTAMVLAVARAMAAAGYRPRRSIVFAHFAGEELGLHGSRALVDEPPDAAPFAGGRVTAMVNLDMVGRLGEQGLEIGAVSTSKAWVPLLDRVRPPSLTVAYTPAVDSRSDHANYARAGVPVLFFFTGLHEDYHRTSDELDKINTEGMAQIGEMVLQLVRTLGDGEAVPPQRVSEPPPATTPARRSRS